jgi:hypothetical protein
MHGHEKGGMGGQSRVAIILCAPRYEFYIDMSILEGVKGMGRIRR